MPKRSLISTFQHPVATLFRAFRYLKQHPVGVVAFLAVVFFAVYMVHQNSQDTYHKVYTTQMLASDTVGTKYTIETYSSSGKLISTQQSNGLHIRVSNIGNLSGGRKALMDTVVINNGNDSMEVSGSTIVAFPTNSSDILHDSDYDKEPIINAVIKHMPKNRRYGSKILLVKTYEEEPIFATYGRSAKSYYSNIDNSQVFKLDGKLMFVFRGEFSISDTTIFSK